jgi:hypothetical protein
MPSAPVRATWLTDLHLNFLDEERLKAFATTLMRERPECILVTGDTGEAPDVLQLFEALGLIAPIYGVLGNHDYYRSTIAAVRERARTTSWWLPAREPIRLSGSTMLVGIDGWGDARCGNLDSESLYDWRFVGELDKFGLPAGAARETAALGTAEAEALRAKPPSRGASCSCSPTCRRSRRRAGAREHFVARLAAGFTCIAVGDALLDHARDIRRPRSRCCAVTRTTRRHRADNLLVRTGAGHRATRPTKPIMQATWSLAAIVAGTDEVLVGNAATRRRSRHAFPPELMSSSSAGSSTGSASRPSSAMAESRYTGQRTESRACRVRSRRSRRRRQLRHHATAGLLRSRRPRVLDGAPDRLGCSSAPDRGAVRAVKRERFGWLHVGGRAAMIMRRVAIPSLWTSPEPDLGGLLVFTTGVVAWWGDQHARSRGRCRVMPGRS